MYTINNQKVNSSGSVNEIHKNINEFLKKEELILVNSNGFPLSIEEVNSILINNTVFNFNATPISSLEDQTINETLSYIKNVINQVTQIVNLEKEVILLSVITDLLEGIEELKVFENHLGINNNFNQIDVQKISLEILREYQTGNENYILDVLEFELLPLYIRLENLLKERKQHELSNC